MIHEGALELYAIENLEVDRLWLVRKDCMNATLQQGPALLLIVFWQMGTFEVLDDNLFHRWWNSLH